MQNESAKSTVVPRGRSIAGLMPALVALIVFSLDQLSKSVILNTLGHSRPGDQIDVIGSWLRFDLVTNSGAAFGMFQDRTLIFTAVAIMAIPALILFHNSLPRNSWLARNCVGLLIGGALGNLVDRVHYGYVVDFIDAGVGNLRWPTFNVADSAFVIGVFILAFYLIVLAEKPQVSAEQSNAGGAN